MAGRIAPGTPATVERGNDSMKLADFLPAAQTRRKAAQQIEFNPDQMLTRKQGEAAFSAPPPPCLSMTEGGICRCGISAHRTSTGSESRMRMAQGMSDCLAAMTPTEQERRLALATQSYPALMEQEQAVPEIVDGLNSLADAFRAAGVATEGVVDTD